MEARVAGLFPETKEERGRESSERETKGQMLHALSLWNSGPDVRTTIQDQDCVFIERTNNNFENGTSVLVRGFFHCKSQKLLMF